MPLKHTMVIHRSGSKLRQPPIQPGSSQPASSNIPPNISSGTGGRKKEIRKTKIAGDLGRYIYKTLTPESVGGPGTGDFSYASEHPDFGGSFKDLTILGTIMIAQLILVDLSSRSNKILAKVLEFNEKYGVTPVELYGKPGTPLASTHGDHVT